MAPSAYNSFRCSVYPTQPSANAIMAANPSKAHRKSAMKRLRDLEEIIGTLAPKCCCLCVGHCGATTWGERNRTYVAAKGKRHGVPNSSRTRPEQTASIIPVDGRYRRALIQR